MKTLIRIVVPVLLLAGLLVLSANAESDKKMAGFFHKAGEKAVKEGEDEKAIQQFRMALKCDAVHPGAVISLARVYMRKIEPSSVTSLYETWLSRIKHLGNPTKEQRAAAKQIKSEMKNLGKLVEIEKRYSRKFSALGSILKSSDKPKAIECYKIALMLDPKNSASARAYKNLTGGKGVSAEDSEIGKLDGVSIGRLLASENFSARTAGWPQNSKAYYQDGRYLVKSKTRLVNIYCRQNTKLKNFYVECKTQFVSDKSEEASAGICFRVLDSRNYYLYHISTSGKLGLWVVKDGIKTDLTGKEQNVSSTDFQCSKPSSEIGKWTSKNVISVAMVKNSIFCYVNRKLIYSCQDDKIYSGGKIGFSVNSGNRLFAFDNFKIYTVVVSK